MRDLLENIQYYAREFWDLLEESPAAKAIGVFSLLMILGVGVLLITSSPSTDAPIRSAAPEVTSTTPTNEQESSAEPEATETAQPTTTEIRNPSRQTRPTSEPDSEAIGTTLTLGSLADLEGAVEANRILKESISLSYAQNLETFSNNFYARQVEYLRELKNYLFIDIASSLRASLDKGVLIETYIRELSSLGQEGVLRLEALQNELTLLSAEINALTSERQQATNDLQVHLSNYEARESYINFEAMQDLQAEIGKLSTQRFVYGILEDNLGRLLTLAQRKIDFMRANKDALVKDVRVVNIEGFSDDLIMSEQEWRSTLQD